MATYFSNSSNQRDVAPTHYLREANYSEQPLLPGGNMMMYTNYSSSSGSYSDTLNGNSQPHRNCVELPSVGAQELTPSQQGMLSNFVGPQTQEQTYNLWRDGRNELMFMQPTGASATIHQSIGGTDDLSRSSVTDDPQMAMRSQLAILGGGHNLQGQGLSLSLNPQMPTAVPAPSFQFHHPNLGLSSFLGSHHTMSGEGGSGTGSCRDDEISRNKQSRNPEYFTPGFQVVNHDIIKRETMNNMQGSLDPKLIHSNSSPYGLSGFTSTIPNSKYLKATQQLLDEVVNVRKALKQHEFSSKGSKEIDGGSKDGAAMPSDNQEVATNSAPELSPVERQDLQNKLTKLLSMLDEVDRRYRQYYHQMQIVVSSFDVVAGCGAAKPYTALALETISRHFRCLRDAISGQIKETRRRLGEQDTSGNNKLGGISRLRFVDQHLRQQKAFQQLGMMQQHAWRPQRGLPESSVSVLRAWLFEHFLHPYPKDSDKIMLARQTGLTRSQVSNWFINARVRLWKPMVEEMYKEEFGDNEMDSISSSDNVPEAAKDSTTIPTTNSNNNNNNNISEDRREDLQQNFNPIPAERFQSNQIPESKCNPISDLEMSGSMAGTSYLNGPRGEHETDYTGIKLMEDQRPNEDDSNLLQDDGRFISADAAYQMAELGRFGSGDGVSLTLGLQHCDGGGLPMSGGTHDNFITMRGDEMYTAATSIGADSADYDCIDPGNRRNRFSSSHMLHDFVA